MAEVELYDSTICRLCAADNSAGIQLYEENQYSSDLSGLINRYLPLKVRDDCKLPRTICPGCNIQLDSTVQFFDLLIKGQKKIREMYKQQVERQKRAEKERLRSDRKDYQNVDLDSLKTSVDDDGLEGNPFESHMIINILPDGSMYATEHEISLQMEGLDKPRKKRGRPPKIEKLENEEDEKQGDTTENVPDITSQEEDDKRDEDLDETDSDSRQRRRRKVPKRYSEAVQGKELERMFKEEGVIDDGDDDIDDNEVVIDKTLEHVTANNHEEIIGHIETIEGKELGELVIINKSRGRGRPKVRRRKNRFTCNICNRGFSQRSRYVMHKNFHKDEKYECAECKKLYNSKDNLLLHQKTTGHSCEEPKISENVEKETEPTVETAETAEPEHVELKMEVSNEKVEHSEQSDTPTNTEMSQFCNEDCDKNKTDKYPCYICGKVLNHPSSVIYHKEAEHNDGRRFVCNKCNKSFKHKQLLQRHQLVHSEDRPYTCKACNASFKTKANLLNHQSTHTGEKKYLCEICNQQFAHKTSLTLHHRWHKGHKPYKCEVCSKSFSQNGNLQEHMRIHTGEKPYCCDFCGRKFTTSSQFKLHVKRHTGERPWKCEFCAKTFLHKDTWKCHVRRHKGEKPFQCNYCSRGFTEQWALKKHQRLHTGEKPYSCDVCGKAFADCSNLTKHKKVHRENKVYELTEPEDPSMDRVWHILPDSTENEESVLTGQVAQVIASEDGAANNAQQIIYVSYQDPDDPLTSTKTLQLGNTKLVQLKSIDASLLPTKESAEIDEQPVAIMNVSEGVVKNVIEDDIYENEGTVEFENSDFQLQITDEKGNPLSLTVEQTRQLLSDKNIMSQLNAAQAIKLHPKIKDISSKTIFQTAIDSSPTTINKDLAQQEDAEESATISIINSEAESQSAGSVLENAQSYEFTTTDGQKLRLFTSYPVDPSIQLDSEYVTIM